MLLIEYIILNAVTDCIDKLLHSNRDTLELGPFMSAHISKFCCYDRHLNSYYTNETGFIFPTKPPDNLHGTNVRRLLRILDAGYEPIDIFLIVANARPCKLGLILRIPYNSREHKEMSCHRYSK